jgi:hypothetical protein
MTNEERYTCFKSDLTGYWCIYDKISKENYDNFNIEEVTALLNKLHNENTRLQKILASLKEC